MDTQARGSSGRVVIISGPSGSGKSTICRLLKKDPRVRFSVSATTRPPRRGEEEGLDYHFMSPDEFRERVKRGEFIENAEVHGHMYGSLRQPMEESLARGEVYVLEIDVQGALQLKALEEPGTYIFISPPDSETLRQRLVARATDSPEAVERRLKKAEDEYRERVKYDHVVVNDDLERTAAEVRRLVGLEESS